MVRNISFFMLTRFLLILTAFGGMGSVTSCTTPSDEERAISYTLSTSDTVAIRDLERVAKVLARDRDLTPAELTRVQEELTAIFEQLVTVELQNMVRAERVIAKAQKRTPRRITRMDARQQLLQRLGRDLALPFLTNESRSTVVFGRVDPAGITVSKETWQTDRPVSQLPEGSTITDPNGKKASLLP
jgi:hypothetical protein